MRFQTGVIAGLAIGYYFGARAGRERYEQIERYLGLVRSSSAVRQIVERLGDAAGVDAIRGLAVDGVAYGHAPLPVPGSYDAAADPTLN